MAISFPIAKPLSTPSRAGIGGPNSAAGKARSAANAVKHGLSSTNPVILEYETLEEWESFRDTFTADLHPVGAVEEELARELALTQWRRRRIPAYEAHCADRRLQTAIASLEYYAERESQPELEERARVVLNEALLPNTEDLTRLLRYEAHLDRKFTQTLRHLHRLQQCRKQAAEAEIYKTNSPATFATATHSGQPPTQPAQAGFAFPEGATSVGPSLATSATADRQINKTNSAPHLPVSAPSVASVPSVPSHPTAPLPNPPAAEIYKTNSHSANPQLAQPAHSATMDSMRRLEAPTEPMRAAYPARIGPQYGP